MAARRPAPGAAPESDLLVQPPEQPIICSPFRKPDQHWKYNRQTGQPMLIPGRRPASYYFTTQRTGNAQLELLAEEERDTLPLVNMIRDDVERWRQSGYEGATRTTRELLRHWADRPREGEKRRLFFCQLEAAETIIYLSEILAAGRTPRWKTRLSAEDYARLIRGERLPGLPVLASETFPTLADYPQNGRPLTRYGCKMATGSGKTVVMAMLIAWAFCNRGVVPADERFPAAALVVCPNLTVKERLQVLRPDHEANYYAAFDLVPSKLAPALKKGRVLITNWHRFAPASPHAEGGKSYAVVNKGEESDGAFAQRVLGDLAGLGSIMVLNDEGHHAYRPAPAAAGEKLSREQQADREEATVWVAGLDRINQAAGIRMCVDVSATPFYLQGSGYIEGSPFPWLVSDFGLVDAIESGIVKIPRLPVSDVTGRPEPRYFALWRTIVEELKREGKAMLPGGRPKPESVWLKAEDALQTLASQYQERFALMQGAEPGQEHVPPVMIIVCDNTDIAKLFYEQISGEQPQEEADIDEEDDAEAAPRRKAKLKKQAAYGNGKVFPAIFSNTASEPLRTLRIDSKLLAEAESDDSAKTRQQAAEDLREIVATVGRPGQPGEQVRCVISVQMLSEGWDANNVTHILGLRAFGSQLLCEQVIGRGLRRMDYTVDDNDMLAPEYVDIYGVPFSLIPYKGRKPDQSASADDTPKNHVFALPERSALEMRFPVVESYVFALRHNQIRADLDRVEPLRFDQWTTPTAVFVKPQLNLGDGPAAGGSFPPEEQNRQAYYESTHLQTIQFEIARRIIDQLTDASQGSMRGHSRHQLFPQVYRIVDQYVRRKVDRNGCDWRELGLDRYALQVVERLIAAIEPNEAAGEPPLVPILNRFKPIGSTADVNFKTKRPVHPCTKSHLNQIVLDTASWEQAAAFRLEQAPHVRCYARNDHMEFVIPYEYLKGSHAYTPDFLVRLTNGLTVVLEIKGHEDAQDQAKHQGAQRWCSAVNTWGKLGRWAFHVCRDPQLLGYELAALNERIG